MTGTRAYQAAAEFRTPRQQEADVIRRATGALRHSADRGGIDRVRALADNRRLWSTLIDLMRDPDNALPPALRADIVSVGMAVQRDMDGPAPDFAFLIAVNETITAGLAA